MLTQYRANVAVMYRTEIDRHLFATASFRERRQKRSDRESMRDWLRTRWADRFARWKTEEKDL
jgi:hypothetical protein